MTTHGISEEALLAQEACFARAFAGGDPAIARDLYQPDVVYVSPTVRLFDWPHPNRRHRAHARVHRTHHPWLHGHPLRGGRACHRPRRGRRVRARAVRLDPGEHRLRSTYVVIYRYRDGLIARQELYYDPSGALNDSVELGMRTGGDSGTLDGS